MICCDLLKIFIDNPLVPALERTLGIDYMENIKAYVILDNIISKNRSMEMLNYCPFCGAKLPERLDDKLTEILQKEYGFKSWRDYKKAPKEFHSDKWWKKRGL